MQDNRNEDNVSIIAIIRQYKNHSSFQKTKNTTENQRIKFGILTAKTEEIN